MTFSVCVKHKKDKKKFCIQTQHITEPRHQKNIYKYNSGVTYLFEQSPSWASEIEHFQSPARKSTCPAICGATFLLFIVFLTVMKIFQKQSFGGVLQKRFFKIYDQKPVLVAWPATLFKKRLCYRCLNFMKLLRPHFLIEHLQ